MRKGKNCDIYEYKFICLQNKTKCTYMSKMCLQESHRAAAVDNPRPRRSSGSQSLRKLKYMDGFFLLDQIRRAIYQFF